MTTAEPRIPVEPKPAASVLLVRPSAVRRDAPEGRADAPEGRADAPEGRADAPEPLEVYMIRRHKAMRFLGGFYAFPGGKVDADDGAPEALARCRGLDVDGAERVFPGTHDFPALAYWITAVRELLEETGLLLVCDADGEPVDLARADVAEAAEQCRKALMAGESFAGLLAAHGWYCDLRQLRYLSHFITPRSSPIRFTARFFLCPVPDGQVPRLYTEETSEGFWIHPDEGYRRFLADEMAMAEPAEYGLAYLAQFGSLDDVWTAHADGRLKFHGIVDRIDTWRDFDWKNARWNRPQPR